jgi:hypothetical protein
MMSAKTPLIPKGAVVSDGNCPMQLLQSKEEHHNVTNNNNSGNDGHAELQFYDPTSILNISKEIACGYLILLTGGAFVYEAPSTVPPTDDRNDDETMNLSAPPTTPTTTTTTVTPAPALLNEETTSLAYAALIDGNVLHACFGLKATANGRSSIPTIGGKNNNTNTSSSSMSYVFCCFSTNTPTTVISSSSNTSGSALHLLLPHLTRNKMKMQTLVELLREVRELHTDEEVYTTTTNYTSSSGMGRNELTVAELYASVGNTTTAATATPQPTTTVIKVPLYLRVIYAYIHCFTCIIKYHDAQELLRTNNTETNKQQQQQQQSTTTTYSNKWWWCFTKPILDPKLELLRTTTLVEIAAHFTGLKDDIWEEIETMANKSAISTMGMSSIEGSAVGSTLSSGGGGGKSSRV